MRQYKLLWILRSAILISIIKFNSILCDTLTLNNGSMLECPEVKIKSMPLKTNLVFCGEKEISVSDIFSWSTGNSYLRVYNSGFVERKLDGTISLFRKHIYRPQITDPRTITSSTKNSKPIVCYTIGRSEMYTFKRLKSSPLVKELLSYESSALEYEKYLKKRRIGYISAGISLAALIPGSIMYWEGRFKGRSKSLEAGGASVLGICGISFIWSFVPAISSKKHLIKSIEEYNVNSRKSYAVKMP